MWKTLILTEILVAAIIYLMLPKKHCVCGDEIPEEGGLCECGEYYHQMIVRREDELKRIKEEKRKGNDYDTVL